MVMPVYNGAPLVDMAVESVLSQTFEDLELIVVDDGSTDDTPMRLQSWAKVDPRMRVLTHGSNIGQTLALRRGCASARGEFIAILDSDDRSYPDRLEHQVAVLEARPKLAVVGSGYEFIDESGTVFAEQVEKVDSAELRRRLESGRNILVHSTWLVRRTAYERAGGYRAPFEVAEDFDLMLRLGEVGQVAIIPRVLVQYRFWVGQLTSRRTRSMARGAALAVALSRYRGRHGCEPCEVDALTSVDQGLDCLGVATGDVLAEEVLLRLFIASVHLEAEHTAPAARQLALAGVAAVRATGGRTALRKIARTTIGLIHQRAPSVAASRREA